MTIINFFFGLGIFLYGMSELEAGIQKLSDARLKALLRSGTNSRLSSISLGVVATAILQSSSMVSLLVLAFASAGLLPLVNAIGVLLGANLGTTATGWIVATLGFKLDLEALAIPLIGGSAFLLVLLKTESRLHSAARLLFGLGLLLLGLALMKSSMEALPQQWNAASITGQSPFVYLLLGIVVTFLVQSSSAVMMMALAALSSSVIGVEEAAALVIGADLGTTSTTILGSLRGSVIKRKLAFAHLLFNLIVDLAAFFFFLPFLPQFFALLSISDPLYGLVAFHSAMNLIGLVVFVPILGRYAQFVERVFSKSDVQAQDILERVPAEITDAALVGLHKKAVVMQIEALCNALRLFALDWDKHLGLAQLAEFHTAEIEHQSFKQGYEKLKHDEGLVSQYILQMQLQPLSEEQARELEAYSQIVRLLIFSNKTLKDISQDLEELRHSSNSTLKTFYEKQRQYEKETTDTLIEILRGNHTQDFQLEELNELDVRNNDHYANMNRLVYQTASHKPTEPMALSVQLNVNHEIQHALRNMIQSIRDILLRTNWEQVSRS